MKRRETNRRGKRNEHSTSEEVERRQESERGKERGGKTEKRERKVKGSEGRVTCRP